MLQGLAAICHAAGNGGYIGSHCPKQSRATSLLGALRGETSLRLFTRFCHTTHLTNPVWQAILYWNNPLRSERGEENFSRGICDIGPSQ